MCTYKIVDMRTGVKATIEGTFDTFAELLTKAEMNLDFSKAKGVISQTKVSLETGSARLPNLADIKIFIYAKDSKGGITKAENDKIQKLLDKKYEEVQETVEGLFEELSQAISKTVGKAADAATANELAEGKKLASALK